MNECLGFVEQKDGRLRAYLRRSILYKGIKTKAPEMSKDRMTGPSRRGEEVSTRKHSTIHRISRQAIWGRDKGFFMVAGLC